MAGAKLGGNGRKWPLVIGIFVAILIILLLWWTNPLSVFGSSAEPTAEEESVNQTDVDPALTADLAGERAADQAARRTTPEEEGRPMPQKLAVPSLSERLVAKMKAEHPELGTGPIRATYRRTFKFVGGGQEVVTLEFHYSGDKKDKCLQGLRLTELPHGEVATNPKTGEINIPGTYWDSCLDGALDRAHADDTLAPVSYKDLRWFENGVRGDQHLPGWQEQFDMRLEAVVGKRR